MTESKKGNCKIQLNAFLPSFFLGRGGWGGERGISYRVNTITRITYTKATNLSKEKTLILTKCILN